MAEQVTLPSSGSGGDNWGTQTVNSDATLAGQGTEADPLKVENSSIEPEWANVKNKPAGFADGEDDVNDNDADPNNEIQTLSVSGDDLSISGGNSVTLPMANKSLWNVDGDNIFRTTGFVGIGTDSPYSKLTFGGTGSELSFMDAATGVASIISWRDQGNTLLSALNYFGIEARFSLSNYATGGDIFIDARDQIVFRSDGNTKMTLFNNGDVGIGTDNPWFKLHVNGGGLFMEESGGLFIRPDENKVNIGYHSPSGYTTNAIFSWDKTQFSGNFNILNGNVGIGTENPERLLHLAGANPRILIEASSSNPEINFKSAGDAATDIWAIYKNSSTGDLHFYQNGNKLTLQKNTGNVGIGTTTPQGKLDVNGAIYQRGGVLHADYVFEENYQLESIEEHTDFMWKNRHLPAIPKATVDENGIEIVEVGAHRKGIVEELEKAHIYISQLEEKLQQQNFELTKRIEKLEKVILKMAEN